MGTPEISMKRCAPARRRSQLGEGRLTPRRRPRPPFSPRTAANLLLAGSAPVQVSASNRSRETRIELQDLRWLFGPGRLWVAELSPPVDRGG